MAEMIVAGNFFKTMYPDQIFGDQKKNNNK